MSCCRPSPSKKEVLSRDTNERIEMSSAKRRDEETKTLKNVKKKREKYLNFKVLDNYVFALESRIPRSKDTNHADIDIFVKVPSKSSKIPSKIPVSLRNDPQDFGFLLKGFNLISFKKLFN